MKEDTMSCENCANAYDEGYQAGYGALALGVESLIRHSEAKDAEIARLRDIVNLARNIPYWLNESNVAPERARDYLFTLAQMAVELQAARDRRVMRLEYRDRKGGEITEWPHDLRVRQYPEVGR